MFLLSYTIVFAIKDLIQLHKFDSITQVLFNYTSLIQCIHVFFYKDEKIESFIFFIIKTIKINKMKEESFTFENQEYIILIGKSREENTELVNTSDPENIWFHVANSPSSHVILKTTCKVKDVPLQVIKRCACLCKNHSKSKSVSKCDIIYTQIKNIESTEIIGQVNTNSATLKFIKI